METNNLNVFSLCLMSTYGSHEGKKHVYSVLLIYYHLSLQIPYTDIITVTVK